MCMCVCVGGCVNVAKMSKSRQHETDYIQHFEGFSHNKDILTGFTILPMKYIYDTF